MYDFGRNKLELFVKQQLQAISSDEFCYLKEESKARQKKCLRGLH